VARGRQQRPGRKPQGSDRGASVSPLTLHRISFYLRCLNTLREERVDRISSQELARRFHLSAAQIRKDLAQFGEFGIRGVGYDVGHLTEHLSDHLGLQRLHRMIIVGMGNLGSALACYFGFNSGAFQVVAGVDRDPAKVGTRLSDFIIRHTDELAEAVRESRAEIGVLAVPADAARENYELLIASGIRGVLNFSPVRLRPVEGVPLKDVDLRTHLEELAYYLPDEV
jgi:redox-sensing transcriptional repressor